MILEFIGADHEVTGSCHYIEVGNKKLIVDYGMEQGVNVYENVPLPVSPSEIDYVFITHAHIDHTGMLPYLYKEGFRGRIFATKATAELAAIMLRDTAHIQESEAEWRNRKAQRSGDMQVDPVFTMDDANAVISLIEGFDYNKELDIDEYIKVRFIDAGHLLGSASIEMWLSEKDVYKKIVFSGDIGNFGKPLIRDPQYIKEADYVLTECTYGDRFHRKNVNHVTDLAKIIQDTLDRGGNVVIPAFAVGRTQEMLYLIRHIKSESLVKNHPNFEVFVDSPLAIEATKVFSNNLIDCYDDDTRKLVEKGINPISFDGLKTAVSSEESKAINFMDDPKVIISASGMCDAGRIRHHLKHNLWKESSTIVFAGYQSIGTLGRLLQDGAKSVRIFGETIEVKAHIATLSSISSHADQDGLLAWASSFKEYKPDKFFAVHGESSVCDMYCKLLSDRFGYDAQAPFSGSIFDLADGTWIKETKGIPISKEKKIAMTESGPYLRLQSAGERLMQIIKDNRDVSNKDLDKFTKQIEDICALWCKE